jgi:integrator complex subunit 6
VTHSRKPPSLVATKQASLTHSISRKAYLFRLPPYYHHCIKRCLRPILPASAHSLLPSEGAESLPLLCFSKVCYQKIRNAEQVARDTNERLERQEAGLRQQYLGQSGPAVDISIDKPLKYGQYDPRSGVESYLAALRSMPPPWRVPGAANMKADEARQDIRSDTASMVSDKDSESPRKSVVEVLGDLPAQCLMAYYESRRRWIFGGPSLTARGLHVEGVNNNGSNSQRCGSTWKDREECPLTLAGVGVSVMNETSTSKMGDYRERWVRELRKPSLPAYAAPSLTVPSSKGCCSRDRRWLATDQTTLQVSLLRQQQMVLPFGR